MTKLSCFASHISAHKRMNNFNPLVSVIVTTFNRKNMLAQTLDSICKQTWRDIEVIVVDNMSQDGTESMVAELSDDRIRYFRNPNYGVIAVNRNFAMRHARGQYIAFCDDDDLWMPAKLSLQLDFLERHPNAVLCYTQATSFMDDEILKEKMISRRVTHAHFFNLLRGNFIPNSSVLVKKKVFDQLGMLNESSDLREDYEMWLRVARHYEIAGLDEPLIKYRVHLNNNAGSKVTETLRAIRTLRSIIRTLKVPRYLYIPNLGVHYLKYLFYHLKTKSLR